MLNVKKIGLPFRYYEYIGNDKTGSILALEKLVGKDDANDAFYLGMQLIFSSSQQEALQWLQMASDHGISNASYVLSMIYSFGPKIGVVNKRNNDKLFFYIERAVKQDPENSGALNYLGMTRMEEF